MRTYGGTSGKLKINSVQMRSNGSVYKDTFWKIASILIYFAGMFVVIKIAEKKTGSFSDNFVFTGEYSFCASFRGKIAIWT